MKENVGVETAKVVAGKKRSPLKYWVGEGFEKVTGLKSSFVIINPSKKFLELDSFSNVGALDSDEGGPPALVIGKQGEASPWTSSVCLIPDPSSPLSLAIDGGSSNSIPPHGLNMVELSSMASKAIDESDTSSMAKLQNLKSAWFAKFGSAEPVSSARPLPLAADDGVVSAAPDGLPSRVSAPQETSGDARGVSSAKVPALPPSDSVSSPPRIPAPPALPEAFSAAPLHLR
ncbi:hypothetical protein Salat_1756300 [Sesamum alatum]|uniref:Uncharacterized protein n=1 Tax=Sesamum alatum TaxID=300844 RepID=A0AAE1Y9N3_9LAMI|nr:hypothetical protein Salat_1756300 [Sesamum alatum]